MISVNETIIVKPEKCVGCNACIRSCPAPEANVSVKLDGGKYIVNVNNEKCISCGECVRTCNHGARDYIDDTEACMQRIESDKVIILASTAMKAALPTQWKGILDWFKKKGCFIFDTALGADISTWAHLRAIEAKRIGNVVSQQCSAVVKYVETYQPKLLTNLSPIHSPELCTAVYLRKYQRRTNPIAVISPCIAKKHEFADTGLVDYNVTIRKLMAYFEKNDIKIPTSPANEYTYPFDEQQGQIGAIYPRPGGFRDALHVHDPELNIVNAEGVNSVFPQLDLYAKMSENKHPKVFDVLSCEFGCNAGPGTGTKQNVFDILETMKGVEEEARNRRKGSGLFNRGDDKLFKQFDDELQLQDFIRSYKPSRPIMMPTDAQLDPIFEKMGKHTKEERSFDCHACGFKTCREMAVAIYRGVNQPENCIVLTRAHHHATGGVTDDERINALTEKCRTLSEEIQQSLSAVTESMGGIDKSSEKIGTRSQELNSLIQNVIEFCNANKPMDEGSVEQLVNILETTQKAFGSLDKNVASTKENSAVITESVAKIDEIVKSLNEAFSE